MTVTILGLDGADWKIINSMFDQGDLPVLRNLVEKGTHGILRSTIPPNSPPAWASMITGVNPGKHNIFDFTYIDDTYNKLPIDAMARISAPPMWRILNQHGVSTGIVNLPIHFPPEPVKGFVVCGVVTPWNAEVFTYPHEISHKIGNPGEQWLIGKKLVYGGDPEAFLEEIKVKTRIQADWTIRLQKEYQPEFLFAVFDGTDKIQHFFWKYWDASHPRYDPRTKQVLRQAIPSFYKDIDKYIGEIISTRPESDVFIVSDHGFVGMTKDFYIEKWLLQKGYLHLKKTPPMPSGTRSARLGSLWNKLAANQTLKAALKGNRFSNWLTAILKQRMVENRNNSRLNQNADWSQTRVFFSGISAQSLQVNLKGREALGIVDPADYDALVQEVISALKMNVDPVTGESIVRSAFERKEIYDGPCKTNAPDIVILTEDAYLLQEGFPDELIRPSSAYGMDRSGRHRLEGIFIACGPNICQHKPAIEADIVDIMPTALYLNGVQIPNYIDGHVRTEWVREEYLVAQPLSQSDEFSLTGLSASEMTAEERELLENHLRALGYF